jgi:hypothetical protein
MTDIDATSIERAVAKRRHFFLSNIQDLTMKMARRQIEKDLGLAPKHLDAAPFKTRIAELVDAVISSGDGADKENTHADKPVKTEKPKPKPERKEEVAAAKKPKRKSVIDSDDDDEVASMGGDVSEEEADYDDSDDDAGSDGSDEASDDDDDMPSDSDDDDIPKKKMKKKAPEPKKAKSKPAPKPSKPKQSAAPITGMVAKLRDQCKKAGLTYQHVFMKRKDDAGRPNCSSRSSQTPASLFDPTLPLSPKFANRKNSRRISTASTQALSSRADADVGPPPPTDGARRSITPRSTGKANAKSSAATTTPPTTRARRMTTTTKTTATWRWR